MILCHLQDALEALKRRKATQSRPPISRSPSVESIQDSDVLVPPSSSPARTPQHSKYFASRLPQKNEKSASMKDTPDKRTDAGRDAKYSSLNGSPSEVLRAIHRHSPQPLRRPKPRYADPDEEESPVKPTLAASSTISSVRQPSLVLAAQSARDDQEEKMIQRLASQFPNVRQSIISSLLQKYPGNPDRAINQIHYANQMKAEEESKISIATTSKASSPLPVSASPATFNSKSKKKNENSTIYANRKRNRRSDGSEEEFSGSESEDDFSDGEDGRKRRKGEDDEPDAEDAALKAFNEDSVETLTGTIGTLWRYLCYV